jgi:hypothetical protein
MPNEVMIWRHTVTYLAVVLAISLLGAVALTWWIGSVSLGIHREDRRSAHAPVTLHGMAPGRTSRVARRSTGWHWA